MTDDWINLGDPKAPRLLPRHDQRWLARLEDITQALGALERVAPKALGRIRDQLAGQPGAASYDGPGTVSGSSHPDPVAVAATHPDQAANDRAQLDKDLTAIRNAAESIQSIVLRYATGRVATSKERRDLNPEPGCDSCGRLPGHQGHARRWEPIHRTGTVNGNLTQSMALCAWCYGFVRDTGRIPTKTETEAHHQGRRVARAV